MQPEYEYVYRPEGLYKRTAVYFGFSFAAHVLLLFFLLFMPDGGQTDGAFARYESIDVQLVSLSPELPSASSGTGTDTGGALEDAPAGTEEESFEIEAQAAEQPQIPVKSGISGDLDSSAYTLELPDQSRDSEPSVKKPAEQARSVATRQQEVDLPEDIERRNREQRVADAVRRLEQETAGDRRQESVRRRIGQMEEETGDQARVRQGRAGVSTSGREGGGRAGGGSTEHFTRLQIYQVEVRTALKNNWAFSEKLAGDTRGLESRIVIKIMPDGEITDVWFEKRSGNDHLDESAYKTVIKTDPLPPLPDGMPHYHLVLGFTPGGLQ